MTLLNNILCGWYRRAQQRHSKELNETLLILDIVLFSFCDIFQIGLDVYEKNNTMRSVFSPGNIFVSVYERNDGQCDVGTTHIKQKKNLSGTNLEDGFSQRCFKGIDIFLK